jgi:hypothetical protein
MSEELQIGSLENYPDGPIKVSANEVNLSASKYEQLKADSELLADLIDFLGDVCITCDASFTEWGVFNPGEPCNPYTERIYPSARDALEAAIKAYKEKKYA